MDKKTKYGYYLDHGEKAGSQWLSELRSDPSNVLDALNDWNEAACSIACDAHDCNSIPGTRLEVPGWFAALTDVLLLWCDAELHIDPAPLGEFNRRLRDFVPRKVVGPKGGKTIETRVAMTDAEIDDVFWRAKGTFDRVLNATHAATANDARVRTPDSKPDTSKTSLPDSPDVRDLCRMLQKGLANGRTQSEIAREFTKEMPDNDRKAQSLLRQARRFSHLWRQAGR